MGGQAVLEGVMMRGASTWAIAVRKPDGEIAVDVREVPGWSDRYAKVPLLRGVTSLAESLGLGYRALTWSANQQVPEEEQISEKALGWAVIPVAVFFSAVFIVIPAFAGKGLSHWFHGSFPIVEGVVRLALFVAYLLLVGCLKDIRRVFQYHGAEHKAIAAYENDVELTPRGRAAVLDRARALRHQLPAHRDGRRGVRVLGDPAAEPVVRDRLAHRADAGDRRA